MIEFKRHDLHSLILLRLERKAMTVAELAKDMRRGQSTVLAALNAMHKAGYVCIASFKKTGGTPVRYWGIGKVDAPRPPLMTPEERSARRRKREEEKRQRLAEANLTDFKPRRDQAAAWF